MANHTLEIKDNKATFTITIPVESVTEGMRDAADHMAEHANIPGFRPGKAGYEVIKQRFGEMKILEEATEELLRAAFMEAMIAEDLSTIGQPYFSVVKMAPGSELVFTVEIALFPKVTKLADYKTLSVKKNDTEPKAEMIEQAKKDLLNMRTKEVRAESGYKITKGDKAVVALGMKKDGVALEGGESQNHGVYTGEEHYIPGFADQLIGLAEGEKKNFTLDFPKDHYQKHLAGTPVDFEIEVKEVFRLEAPLLDDEFAKSVGLKTAAELEEKLKENLQKETALEEERRLDKETLELLADKSTFETIPDLLLNQEVEKMIQELKHSITRQQMDFDEYLKNIGKTLAEIKLDFTPNALTRIKVAMILKEVSAAENIKPAAEEVDAELDRLAEQYKDNKEAKDQIYSAEYRDYIEHQMTNRKTIDFLKGVMVK